MSVSGEVLNAYKGSLGEGRVGIVPVYKNVKEYGIRCIDTCTQRLYACEKVQYGYIDEGKGQVLNSPTCEAE